MAFRAYIEDKRLLVKKEFCKESLFRCVYKHLNDSILYNPDNIYYDYSIIELWEDAKEFVKNISKADHPDIELVDSLNLIKNRYSVYDATPRGNKDPTKLVDQYTLSHFESKNLYQYFMVCAFSMLYVYFHTDKETPMIIIDCADWINKRIEYQCDDLLEDIQQSAKSGTIVHDYNYWYDKNTEKEVEPESNQNFECNKNESDESINVITGKRGQTKTHCITAKKAGYIISQYAQKGRKLSKDEWCTLGSKLTGISANTLKDSVRMQ